MGTDYQQDREGKLRLKTQNTLPGRDAQESWSSVQCSSAKENTDLKVDKVTMQKELAHARKALSKTERELEQYRLHLQDTQKDIQRKHLDEHLQRELESLKASGAEKDQEIHHLKQRVSAADNDEEQTDKLRGDIEDLKAEIREKERWIDERDDQIDRLKEQAQVESDEVARLSDELEDEKKRVEDLQEHQDQHATQAEQLQEAQEDLREALEAKQKAEEDLQEVSTLIKNFPILHFLC